MVNTARASFGRRFLGAFVSFLVASLFLQVIALIFTHTRGLYRVWWVDPVYLAIGSFPFVFVPWLIVFVPLYLFVPLRSFLWWWPVCTACGTTFGGVVMYLLSQPHPQDGDSPLFTSWAAMTAGILCLFASLTMPKYHYTKPSNQSLEPTAGRCGEKVEG
jgi:hypothetical protein